MSVIFSGSPLTRRHLKPNLSLAIIACNVLSLPPLTPITQSYVEEITFASSAIFCNS